MRSIARKYNSNFFTIFREYHDKFGSNWSFDDLYIQKLSKLEKLTDCDIMVDKDYSLYSKLNKIINQNDYKNKIVSIDIKDLDLNDDIIKYLAERTFISNEIKICDLIYCYLDCKLFNSSSLFDNINKDKYKLDWIEDRCNHFSRLLYSHLRMNVDDDILEILGIIVDYDRNNYMLNKKGIYLFRKGIVSTSNIKDYIFNNINNETFNDLINLLNPVLKKKDKLKFSILEAYVFYIISNVTTIKNLEVGHHFYLNNLDLIFKDEFLNNFDNEICRDYIKDLKNEYDSLIKELDAISYFKYKEEVDLWIYNNSNNSMADLSARCAQPF